MMNTMHVRRDDEPTEYFIDSLRDIDIAVIERSRSVQDDFEGDHGQRVRAEQQDPSDFIEHRKNDFQRMKTNRRCRIESHIGVMNLVQAP